MRFSFQLLFAGKTRQLFTAGLVLGGTSALYVCASAETVGNGSGVGAPRQSVVTLTPDSSLVADGSPVTDGSPVAGASAMPVNLSGVSSSVVLPNAPEPQLKRLNAPPSNPKEAAHIAPIRAEYIPAGWTAQPLGVRGKIVAGAADIYSFTSIGAIVLSAAYAHVADGQPNYGVNSKAFAQRLGASAARETSQTVFSEIVLAPLLREDPRYYQKGPAYNPFKRTLYAITRPLITRTDSGRSTVNGALLLGYAAAAAITPAYYPQSNRNFHDVASTYGGSIGGAALGDLVEEFADDVLEAVHLKRKP